MSEHFLWLIPAGIVFALIVEVCRGHLCDLSGYLRELRLLREQEMRRRSQFGPDVAISGH